VQAAQLTTICLQAAELGETLLAVDCRTRQLASSDPVPVLQWTTQRASPALILELGRGDNGVGAVAVLQDGRVVTGGRVGGGPVLVWDPTQPGTGPAELGRHEDGAAAAVLPDGRVVTGGDDRVRLWDVQSASPGTLLACSGCMLATSLSPSGARLFIGHAGGGISCWEVRQTTPNTPAARQRAGNATHQPT